MQTNKFTTAVIVDDEPMARLNIRDAIGDFPNWQVLAEFDNADRFLNEVEQLQPDVVFLDISMPGKSGLEAAQHLARLTAVPHIVFVTAFDEYAIQAFDLYAVDYLLKPFDTPRFTRCVNRVSRRLQLPESANDQMQAFLEKSPIDKLVIKSTASIRVINMQEVYWFGSNGNYVEVHHTQGCHLHRGSLAQLEASLDPTLFCRVHRQVIVRLDQAKELKSISENKNKLLLNNGDWVNVSEHYKPDFLHKWA